MRIAITSEGKDLNASVDPRFGRCAYFIIVDTDNVDNFEAYSNPAVNASGGAGVQAAKFIVKKNVQAVITINCGPKAFQTLQSAGIKVILANNNIINGVIECLRKGIYNELTEPNVPPHSGLR